MRFEIVKNKYRKFPNEIIKLPERKTTYSAGYDFYSNETHKLKQNECYIFWTDVKIKLEWLTFLQISIRSSLGLKNLRLANGIGIVDSDYYDNPNDDGNIGIALINESHTPYLIQKGDRIAQGIILPHLMIGAGYDKVRNKRKGGWGSTK